MSSTEPTTTVAPPASVVQDILDDCLESDYAYDYVRYDTADRIVAALREAGMLRG